MAFPPLTPTSTTSAIILPEDGVEADVAASLAIGFYSTDAFLSGAASQVAYTHKRLGGDVLDIELTAKNVYNHYEEACLEYSYIVNLHQARNALLKVKMLPLNIQSSNLIMRSRSQTSSRQNQLLEEPLRSILHRSTSLR